LNILGPSLMAMERRIGHPRVMLNTRLSR
jgi:hypothetical protein